MERIIEIIRTLISRKFSGDIIITFNNGGIRGVRKARYESL